MLYAPWRAILCFRCENLIFENSKGHENKADTKAVFFHLSSFSDSERWRPPSIRRLPPAPRKLPHWQRKLPTRTAAGDRLRSHRQWRDWEGRRKVHSDLAPRPRLLSRIRSGTPFPAKERPKDRQKWAPRHGRPRNERARHRP